MSLKSLTSLKSLCAAVLFGLALSLSPAVDAAEPVAEFKQGDRIAIIGNGLAERMQHDGWLETVLQSRLPGQQLVFRNLGFSGDELTTRSRASGFGSPDDWLKRVKADVVFAFFGYNESFAGKEGLQQFEQNLAGFIEHTVTQKYNGKSNARLVLFSPMAFEDTGTPNLPDGTEHNKRLALYTQAMAKVAKQNGVPFVDLFTPSQRVYEQTQRTLTINGVHLNEHGNRHVAQIADRAFFPNKEPLDLTNSEVQKLREAVQEKNFYWFHRYRTTDGYNVYGGRSYLKYPDKNTGRKISNREVLQREMKVLDVMTANRDRRVWARAQGRDIEVDDSNTPPFIPITTNKPGPLPGGKYRFLGGEESIKKMTVGKGMQVNLFASEEMFPELINPVQMAFDTKGRLWAAVWPSYPHWKPKTKMDDKLLIFEDTNGDGQADECKTFAGGLHNPTGFEFWGGGVIVSMAPHLLFLKDTDGDDKADVRVKILHGLDSADTHHTANSFVLGPGGGLYFGEGVFHQSQIETVHEGALRNKNAAIWRFNPRRWKVDRHIPVNFANPHGNVIDRWGQQFVHDGTGAQPYHATLISGHLDYPKKHPKPPQLYRQRTRPCPGTEILSSEHFPPELQGNLLVGNVIGFQGILQYEFSDKGASFGAKEVEPIVYSSDPNFRPTDMEIGPRGEIFFTEWQNPIIGHMQHHLRDPNRDKKHGRIYRVSYPSRPLIEPVRIAGEPLDKLLDLLKNPNDRIRYRVRIELSGRETDAVIAAAKRWVKTLDKNDPAYEHHLTEALWLHQQHNVMDEQLLNRVLRSPDFHARAAATRVVCYMRHKLSDPLALLEAQAEDEHPRVRLEAVRACSFFRNAHAAEVALLAVKHPTDQYIEFTLEQTLRQLEPYWKQAVSQGKAFASGNPAGVSYILDSIPTRDLLKFKRSEPVYVAILSRPGIDHKHRMEALQDLAKLKQTDEMAVLLDNIEALDTATKVNTSVMYDLAHLLTMQPAEELKNYRQRLMKLADSAKRPISRQIGYVATVTADGSVDAAWKHAARSIDSLRDFLDAVPIIPDASLRASLYGRVKPLLYRLPKPLAKTVDNTKGVKGRYVRIELPGRRKTLTLAEVEVFSGGLNVARQGKARQSSTAHGGVAKRAIDGNTSGEYGSGGQTHTKERRRNPWWEVDLRREVPIDEIRIWNRSEQGGKYAGRLNGYKLSVLDADRNAVFVKADNPAPPRTDRFELQGNPESTIRRSAINAVTYIPGHEAEVFGILSGFVRQGDQRHAAVRAIQRIPKRKWPKDDVRPLVMSIVKFAETVPATDRALPSVLDALQLGKELASLLPEKERKQVLDSIGDLGVQIIRIRPVPHKMMYDRTVIAVQAGKPVQIIFENIDIMPHNLLILRPGSLQEIGEAGERMATQPGAFEKSFIPDSPKVLFHTGLLNSREIERLTFVAPEDPGTYPYVCTFPGHWRRMRGKMHVVEDLEAYLAENPLPEATPTLDVRPYVKDWKYEDLAGSLDDIKSGRSFVNGKNMFKVAACITCHQMNGEGGNVGPELSKYDPKMKPADILREMTDPSKNIKDKFRTWVIVDAGGKQYTGMILEEDKQTVTLVENPLGKDDPQPIRIPTDDIEFRKPLKTSLMPNGLLKTLKKEEILDLLAYIVARGKPDHPAFRKE